MKLLDLFCGAGGCAEGYHRAGFEVVGVDHEPQKRYPFEFHQADALAYCRKHGAEFDAIHASPPCQAYSVASALHRNAGRKYPDLVSATRDAMEQTGRPWIIENVPGAPLQSPIVLCGSMFDELNVRRHRLFELGGFMILQPECRHAQQGPIVGVYGHSGGSSRRDGLTFAGVDAWRDAMGIDWMTGKELSQAIPPAYTHFIGRQLIKIIA